MPLFKMGNEVESSSSLGTIYVKSGAKRGSREGANYTMNTFDAIIIFISIFMALNDGGGRRIMRPREKGRPWLTPDC